MRGKCEEFLEQTLDYLCKVYIIIMAFVFAAFLSEGYIKGGTDKGMLYIYISVAFCGMGLLLFIPWFILQITGNRAKLHFSLSPIGDRLLLLYLILQPISYLLSNNKEEALLGVHGWYQGLLPMICVLLSYFFISRFLTNTTYGLGVLSIGSVFIFLLAILNRFDIDPLGYNEAGAGFISTMGNINWFCGYWSVFFGVSLGLFFCKRNSKFILQVLYAVYFALSVFVGAIQGSDVALLVFAVSFLALLFYAGFHTKEDLIRVFDMCILAFGTLCVCGAIMRITDTNVNYQAFSSTFLTNPFTMAGFVILFLVLRDIFVRESGLMAAKKKASLMMGIVCILVLLMMGLYVIVLIINTKHPGVLPFIQSDTELSLFTADFHWGSSRGITWYAGICTFLDADLIHKIFGWGPESFAYGLYQSTSRAGDACNAFFEGARLTNAHNELITVLVNAGIVGALTYALSLFNTGRRFIKSRRGIAFAAGFAILSYSANNLFSFAQPVNITYLFLVMGIGEAYLRRGKEEKKEIETEEREEKIENEVSME